MPWRIARTVGHDSTSRRAVRNERPHHEARRHSTSDNDATRARGRLRPRDRRNRRRPVATGPCRLGSDRQPVRRRLRRDRHLRRGHCRDALGPVGRRLAPQRPRRPSGRGARREFSASCRRPSLRPVRRSGCRHRPCLARLAADAGHALPRHLPDRAPHGHQWSIVGRPMVLGRCRAAGDEPRRAAAPDEDLEPCRPAGRGGGDCRRRSGVRNACCAA